MMIMGMPYFQQVLKEIADVTASLGMRFSKKPCDSNPIEYYSDSETE